MRPPTLARHCVLSRTLPDMARERRRPLRGGSQVTVSRSPEGAVVAGGASLPDGSGSATRATAPSRPVESPSPVRAVPLPPGSQKALQAAYDAKREAIAKFRVAVPTGIPSREAMIALTLDVYKLALDNVRTYSNRSGRIDERPEPDFRAACEAIRVAAQIAGYTLKGSESAGRAAAGEEVAEVAIEKLRARISKKADQ